MIDPPADRPAVRRSGRPTTIKPDSVAAAGLRLFLRDGFEQTTMSQVAVEAGIGRKTLFAYFPTKADIVWNRFRRQLEGLIRALDRAPMEAPATDAVVSAVMQGLDLAPKSIPILRAELVLIKANPSLEAYAHVAGRPWREAIAKFLAARSGQRPDDLLPQVLGYGYWHAMFVGFDRWLASRDKQAEKHVREALTEYAQAVRGALQAGPRAQT